MQHETVSFSCAMEWDEQCLGRASNLSLCVRSSLCLQELQKEGVKARVVSMVCWELFEEQPKAYKDSVLPPDVTNRVSVEAGTSFGWQK